MKKTVIAILLLCGIATAQEIPKIAVYVTGGKSAGEDRALTAFILAALIKSGKYEAVERSDDFVTQIDRELETQYSGAVDDNQIRRLGIQAGVRFVCVADITPAFEAYQMSARIIDVETAKVVAIGVAGSDMESMDEMEILANDIVAKMLGLKNANDILGESAADKRRQEKAEAERRKKMERDRRKTAEAKEREEEAVRREKEKADKAERREQEKSDRVERLEREEAGKRKISNILFPDLGKNYDDYVGGDGKWHFHSLGIFPPGVGLGIGVVDHSVIPGFNFSVSATIRRENYLIWEPRIDLMVGGCFYGDDKERGKVKSEAKFEAFYGWTKLNSSSIATKWQWYFGYGAAYVIVNRGLEEHNETGVGIGGQIGLEYSVGNDHVTRSGILDFGIRPMYCVIPKNMKNSHLGIAIEFIGSYCKGIFY
jgi:hypothetical protein